MANSKLGLTWAEFSTPRTPSEVSAQMVLLLQLWLDQRTGECMSCNCETGPDLVRATESLIGEWKEIHR